MKIYSPAFDDNGRIPLKYTCLGDGINPPLIWEQIPVNAKSLALIMDDPDAVGGLFSHWIMWNIPIVINGISEDEIPEGVVVGVGTSGDNKYFPPCPPNGEHRYQFKLFALDKELFLSKNTKQEDLEKAMNGHTIGKAMLVGLFGKK